MNSTPKHTNHISIIVATARNRAIGRNNQLLWHISEDLKYFKRITSGNTVIMGRKTFESIGKPLPNRMNIVVSRSMERNDLVVCRSLPEAIKKARNEGDGEIFIIGGGEIYEMAMGIADKIYLTVVDQVVNDADTFFPEINQSLWEVQEKESVGYGERLVLRRK